MDGPSAQKELALVDKLELRIALADSDAKLQALLSTYLCPLLLKLQSPHKSVRDKVIEICQHVNTRTSAPAIQLPVTKLLEQFKGHPNPLVRHFDIIYISRGLDRTPLTQRSSLLPTLIKGIAKDFSDSASNTSHLFNLLLRILPHVNLPPRGSEDDTRLRQTLSLSDPPQDAQFVADWIGKTLLYTPLPASRVSPGLNIADHEFLNIYGKPDVWNPGAGGISLVETKVLALRFIASGAFTDAEKLLPGAFASADPNYRLAELGEDILKRVDIAPLLENREFVDLLFSIYLGQEGQQGSLAAAIPLQVKLLALLSKSRLATNRKEDIVRIVRAGLSSLNGSTQGSGPVKRGLEASKLRRQLFVFTNWVARNGVQSSLEEIAPVLVGYLKQFIEDQGWPVARDDMNVRDSLEISSRNYCYESIGLFAKACPSKLICHANLDLLLWLFRSLGGDNWGSETALSIENALASILNTLMNSLPQDLEAPLADLLLQYSCLDLDDIDASGTKVLRSTRYVALRFANRCLPFANVPARCIALIALGNGENERREIIEEAKKGLDPYWYKNMNPLDTITHNVDRDDPIMKRRYEMPHPDELTNILTSQSSPLLVTGAVHSNAIIFWRNISFHAALVVQDRAPAVDHDWQKNLDVLVTNDEKARSSIQNTLAKYTNTSHSPLLRLVDSAFVAFTQASDSQIRKVGDCLLEIFNLGPDWLRDVEAPKSLTLRPYIFSSVLTTRVIASQLFGQLGSRVPNSVEDAPEILYLWQIARGWRNAVGQTVHQVHGSIMTIAFFISSQRMASGPSKDHESLESEFSRLLADVMCESRDRDLIDASVTALDQLCLFATFEPACLLPSRDVRALIGKLYEMSKLGNENSVLAMGHLSMQLHPGSLLDDVFEKLFQLHEQRRPELQFAVGSAISCASAGWDSKALIQTYSPSSPRPRSVPKMELLNDILHKVLQLCEQTKPAARQASAIWLLCLVQYCGHLPAISSRLRQLQKAFVGFLADRDNLNQETASRGLTIIYEKGDSSVKDDLVRDLISSFTSSSSNLGGTVSDETQLFEPGALPTRDGSVTTYKDIVSLANEVGDPSLIYRFMSLALSSSIWSSRVAFGRFGLGKILEDSSINGYLAGNPKMLKLFPVLFRYRFDPNTKVRSSMNEIWNSLVKDTRGVVDLHFNLIMEDLLKNVLGKEWRTREASCAAISDLLQGRSFVEYQPYLTDLWTVAFKVCDDIKETVRKAGMALARVLTGFLIRSLESSESSVHNADSMLRQVLPFLLGSSGMESSAEEVRGFALATLLDIIRKSSANNKILRPYVGELVGDRLLLLLSSLEPEAINYIHLNAEKYGLSEQQIDDARLSGVRTSPMMEAIERCLDMLDRESMGQLASTLANAVKTVIGLPSKVGVSKVLVSLSTRHNLLFKPFADDFLKLMRRHMLDRNDTVSASAATACGYLCRISSDQEVLNHGHYAQQLYFESGDERHRNISGDLMHGVTKYATDRFQNLAASMLPFVFVAKHDTSSLVKASFRSAWDEGLGGARSVKLYLPEIIGLIQGNIDSSHWPVKHACSFAVSDAINLLGESLSTEEIKAIWPALKKAISCKTWQGKEVVLKAFVTFIKRSSQVMQKDGMEPEILNIMIRETKRNNTGTYRRQAMASLGEFAQLYPSKNLFDEVYAVLSPIADSLLDRQSGADIEGFESSGDGSSVMVEETLGNLSRSLMFAVNPSSSLGSQVDHSMLQCLSILEPAARWKHPIVLNAIFEGESSLLERISHTPGVQISERVLKRYLEILTFAEPGMPELTRVKAAETLGNLAILAKEYPVVSDGVQGVMGEMGQKDRSYLVKEALEKARNTTS